MPSTTRGSILISTANDIGTTLVDKLGGTGYTPDEWDSAANLCGIASADIETALENITESTPQGAERGSMSIAKANSIGAVLNKKFNTSRGFKPKEWASAASKLEPLPERTASGAIANITDGADDVPLKSCTCEIVPQQDLHGYANPWAPGAGKNKLPKLKAGTYGTNGATFIVDDKGIVTMSGTTTSSGNAAIIPFDSPIEVTADMQSSLYYHLNNSVVNASLAPTLEDSNFVTAFSFACSPTNRVAQIPSNAIGKTISQCRFYVAGNVSLSGTFAPALMSDSSATSYEPYSNVCPITGTTEIEVTHTDGQNPPIESETRSVELDTPIYSGSAEILGGNGLANGRKKIKDFGTWIYVANYTGYFQIEARDMKAPVDNYTPLSGLYCEAYKTGTATEAGSGNVNGTIAGVISGNSSFLRIKNNNYSDVNDFIRDFGDYYVVYPLATPDPFTFDPAPEISSYLGDNNIFSDVQGGTTTVEYRADIDLAQ